MLRSSLILIIFLGYSSALYGQAEADTVVIARLLQEFLKGASENNAAVHERFWDDELIYTGSSGRRVGKSDILREVYSVQEGQQEGNPAMYSAQDIQIRLYGNAAVVVFRLVATRKTLENDFSESFFNTGVFVKRSNEWRVVAWQATKISE